MYRTRMIATNQKFNGILPVEDMLTSFVFGYKYTLNLFEAFNCDKETGEVNFYTVLSSRGVRR